MNFDAARGRSLEGHGLQRQHRNTPASDEAFGAALDRLGETRRCTFVPADRLRAKRRRLAFRDRTDAFAGACAP